MKKIVRNIWVRLFACILCTLSVVALGASVVAMLLFSYCPAKEDFLRDGNNCIMKNYAMYAIEHLNSDELDEFFAKTNMYIIIEKSFYESEESENPTIVEVYSNKPEDAKMSFGIDAINSDYISGYNVNSLLLALRYNYYHDSGRTTITTPIRGYVFDVNTGIFYYDTTDGYFKADYIFVCKDGIAYDYNLIAKSGREYYYNSYYGRCLDTAEYEEWDWVSLDGKRMGLTENYGANTIQLVTDNSQIEGNLRTENYESEYFYIHYVSDRVTTYNFSVGMKESLEADDLLAEWNHVVEKIYSYQTSIIGHMWLFLILLICGIILLAVSAPSEKEALRFYHRIPVAIFTGLMLGLEFLIGYFLMFFCQLCLSGNGFTVSLTDFVIQIANIVAIMAFIFFVFLANFITRIKTRSFFRYSELYYISRPILSLYCGLRENTSLVVKGLFIFVITTIIQVWIIVTRHWDLDGLLALFTLYKIVEIPIVLYVLVQMRWLQKGSERIASGDLTPVDTKGMIWEFKKHGENINKVREGISVAVEEQIKSERFKTELITNVSHDIKTPLTSIINYVDLIKKEEITDPTMVEYVDVLDRQSARLKKLIEDLMEASKASTGNIEVHLEECDMNVLLSQVVGEFEEKLTASGLEIVMSKPEEPVKVMVDGRHMWRVLDNLLNNICKYSQPNTRVYVSLEQGDKEVVITFKNISKTALNIPSEQLMQRFVRGDSSRHTEGSGLGLSIAQSLTELMNGSMKLDIDGDLFKVILTFRNMV